MGILFSIAYCFFWAIVGYAASNAAIGATGAAYVAILMGIAAFCSSLCGYIIGKSKR